MTMEDVWVETVHESERRDGKKNNSVPAGKEKVSTRSTTKRAAARKNSPTKDNQETKRAA